MGIPQKHRGALVDDSRRLSTHTSRCQPRYGAVREGRLPFKTSRRRKVTKGGSRLVMSDRNYRLVLAQRDPT
jgi:hypothetical protein